MCESSIQVAVAIAAAQAAALRLQCGSSPRQSTLYHLQISWTHDRFHALCRPQLMDMADHPDGLDLSLEQALLVVCSTQVASHPFRNQHSVSIFGIMAAHNCDF